jgi:hypothetical protein
MWQDLQIVPCKEGCFIVTIIKDNKYKLGRRAACRFVISLNDKDINVLIFSVCLLV